MKPTFVRPLLCLLICLCAFALYAQEPRQYETVHILRGHTGGLHNLRFSPDGKSLATCGMDGNIFVWDVASGQMKSSMKGHAGNVIEVSFSPNGRMLASAGSDGTARVWDVSTGNQLRVFTADVHPNKGISQKGISFATFSADNNTLFYGGDSGYIMRVGIGEGQTPRRFFSTNKPDGSWYGTITGGTFSLLTNQLYVSVGNDLIVIDAFGETGKYSSGIMRKNSDFNDVICGPKPNLMTAWAWDGKVLIYDIASRSLVKELQVTTPNNYSLASFSADGKLLVTGADAAVAKVWDWESNARVALLSGHTRIVRTARFSPTEDVIATASYDGTARIWRQPKDIVKKVDPVDPTDSPLAKRTDPPVVIRDTIREKVVIRDTVTVREKVVIKDTVRVKVKETIPPTDENKASLNESDLEVGKTLNLKNIQFKQGTSEMLPMSRPELERLKELMLKYPKLVIELSGHTDNVGQQSINLRLSADRVRVVQNYLTGEGIAEKRILTRAFGGSRPVASNEQEDTRKLNRRVEVTIISL